MTIETFSIVAFFVILMILAGSALFFGSDYAQRKWNPEGK